MNGATRRDRVGHDTRQRFTHVQIDDVSRRVEGTAAPQLSFSAMPDDPENRARAVFRPDPGGACDAPADPAEARRYHGRGRRFTRWKTLDVSRIM